MCVGLEVVKMLIWCVRRGGVGVGGVGRQGGRGRGRKRRCEFVASVGFDDGVDVDEACGLCDACELDDDVLGAEL